MVVGQSAGMARRFNDLLTRWVPRDDDGRVRVDLSGSTALDFEVMDNDQSSRGVPRGSSGDVLVTVPVVLPGRGAVTRVDGFGNSLMAGEGTEATPEERYLRRFAKAIGASDVNSGVGGSTVIGNLPVQLSGALARSAGGVAGEAAVVDWILNDPAYFGPNCAPAVAAAHRELISRILTDPGDVRAYDDSSIALAGSWSAAGGAFKAIAGAGSQTLAVPAGWRGRIVAFNVAAVQDQGAVHTVTTDSSTDGTPAVLDTRGLYPAAPVTSSAQVFTCVRKYIPLDATSVTMAVSSVVGATYTYGYQVESAAPRLVLVLGQNHLPTYAIYNSTPFLPTDAVVDAINAAVAALVAEFSAFVVFLPKEDVVGKQRANFVADQTHMSVAGNRIVGALALNAARTYPVGTSVRAATASPSSTLPALEAARTVGGSGQPPFGTGWGAPPAGIQSLRFYKDQLGLVHIEGSVQTTAATAADATIFTLPAGYRPSNSPTAKLIVGAEVGTQLSRQMNIASDTGVVSDAVSESAAGFVFHFDATFRTT